MAGIGNRLKRLEAAHPARRKESEADARRARVMDRFYFEMNNARRELDGLDPLHIPEDLEETREEILETLSSTIPYYRQHGGWRYGDGAEFLAAWEDRLLEKLADLERGEHTHE